MDAWLASLSLGFCFFVFRFSWLLVRHYKMLPGYQLSSSSLSPEMRQSASCVETDWRGRSCRLHHQFNNREFVISKPLSLWIHKVLDLPSAADRMSHLIRPGIIKTRCRNLQKWPFWRRRAFCSLNGNVCFQKGIQYHFPRLFHVEPQKAVSGQDENNVRCFFSSFYESHLAKLVSSNALFFSKERLPRSRTGFTPLKFSWAENCQQTRNPLRFVGKWFVIADDIWCWKKREYEFLLSFIGIWQRALLLHFPWWEWHCGMNDSFRRTRFESKTRKNVQWGALWHEFW